MLKLSADEKENICVEFTAHMPKLRKLLNLTQEELGGMSGLSRVTISQIESGKVKLTWLHLNAILFICFSNLRTKEYIYANKLLGPLYLRYMQGLDRKDLPDLNADISSSKLVRYQSDMFSKSRK